MHAHDQQAAAGEQDQQHDATALAEPAGDATRFSAHGPLPDVVAHDARTHRLHAPPSASDRAFHSTPGGDRNIDIAKINTDHRARTDAYPTHAVQSSRVSLDSHHHKPTELLPGDHPVYDSGGKHIGKASGGPIDTNAGTFCHLPIKQADGSSKNEACVFTHGTIPGWIPTSAFKHGAELGTVQHHMSNAIDRKRHAAQDMATDGQKFTIIHREAHAKLFTKPFEKATDSNEKSHYYGRANGTQSLFVNVPTWNRNGSEDGERFGVANDTVMAAKDGASGTDENTFHFTGETAKSPLYKLGENHEVGHIEFHYGYVINAAGEKRLGWLPQDVLAPKN